MPRATIRAGIVDYLQAASITGLGSVFAHPPKQTGEGEFQADQTGSGAVIYVHLAGQEERRIATGGPTDGMKLRAYEVALICVFRSKLADTEAVGAANDQFLDSLTAAVQANRTPTAVWQWGEGDTFGAPDVRVEAGMPRPIRQQASQVWSICTVTALELLPT